MEATNDHAVNRLKILSSDQSFNKNSGALIVNGGIACKKAISAKCLNVDNLNIKDLTLNTLHVKESTVLDGSVTINNDLTINNLTSDNLIPLNETSSIGSGSNRVYNIYNNYIDTNCAYVNDSLIANTIKTNNLIVGDDKCENDDPVINADNIEKTINMNICELNVGSQGKEMFSIGPTSTYFGSLLRVKYQNIDISCKSYSLYVESSIVVINSKVCTNIQLMKTIESGSSVQDGTFVKIYNQSENCIDINSCKLLSKGSIEFIYMCFKEKWVELESRMENHCIPIKIPDTTYCHDTECQNTECNTTTDCGDSSVFTVDNSHCK